MKLVSWNVNGLRACMGKGFMDFFTAVEADVFCLQETKMQEGQVVFDFPGYQQFQCEIQGSGSSFTPGKI